eukprot:scaffold308323_cov24-Prasinocladus_malaysianus.AAC.1
MEPIKAQQRATPPKMAMPLLAIPSRLNIHNDLDRSMQYSILFVRDQSTALFAWHSKNNADVAGPRAL